jgi:hypothetical protein
MTIKEIYRPVSAVDFKPAGFFTFPHLGVEVNYPDYPDKLHSILTLRWFVFPDLAR